MSDFIKDKMNIGFKIMRSILVDKDGEVRKCILKYPNNAKNIRYRSKKFQVECIARGIMDEDVSDSEHVFTSEAIYIFITQDVIDETLDTEGGVVMLSENFKRDAVSIIYNNKPYDIKIEKFGAITSGVRLICDRKN